MDDKELSERLTEASWSLDYPEDLIAVKAASRLTALAEENERLRDAVADALSGWRYIRSMHGDLYGVGWERVEEKLTKALEVKP